MDNFLEAYFGSESDVDYIKEHIKKDKNKYQENLRFTSEFKIFEVKPDGTRREID